MLILLALTSYASIAAITDIAKDNLVVYYSFDAGDATDHSGNNNDGYLGGGVDCNVNGISGKACSFEDNTSYIEIQGPLKYDYYTFSF